MIQGVAGLFGRRDEGRQARENTLLANKLAQQNETTAWKRNKQATNRANKFNVRQAAVAEKRSDANAKVAMAYNAAEANKARNFSRAEANKANALSEERDLRNRQWAQDDYAQQKDDFATQFQRSRDAAIAGGFNPLSALGAQMTPGMGAGGLSSSSYGGGGAAAASTGFASASGPTSSVPMSYGAPVAVQPLASNMAIVGGISELGQELTGVNAVQRQTDTLYRDLAQLELDQRRSGVNPYAAPAGRVPSLGSSAIPTTDTSASEGPGYLTDDTWTDAYGNVWDNRNGRLTREEDGVIYEYRNTPQARGQGIIQGPVTGGTEASVFMDPSDEMLTRSNIVDLAGQVLPQVITDRDNAYLRSHPEGQSETFAEREAEFYEQETPYVDEMSVARRQPAYINSTVPLLGAPPLQVTTGDMEPWSPWALSQRPYVNIGRQ